MMAKNKKNYVFTYIMLLISYHRYLCTSFTGILRSSSSNQALFITQCIGGIYSRTPIKILSVQAYLQCALECLDEKYCKSFNFKYSTNDECELLDANINSYSCTSKHGWNYYDATVQEMISQEISAIKDATNQFCLVPKTLDNEVIDGTELVLKSDAVFCNEIWAKFIFKHEEGDLIHFESNKRVCAKKLETNEAIILDSTCPEPTLENRWTRTMGMIKRTAHLKNCFRTFCTYLVNSLSYGNFYCIGRQDSQMSSDYKPIILMELPCNPSVGQFSLYELDRANVLVSVWQDIGHDWGIKTLTENNDYPEFPTLTNLYIDHMFSTPNTNEHYGLSMKAYFVPPVTGIYFFYLVCDNWCQLRFGEKEENHNIIITTTLDQNRFFYGWEESSSQRSTPQSLKANVLYYMEALLHELNGLDYVQVGMTSPFSKTIIPVTFQYLKSID